MSQIVPLLRNLGLTATEAKLYTVGLEYTAISVNELVKQTGVNRTTIYHAIGTLEKKGLVAKKNTGNKLLFVMTRPDRIDTILDNQIEDLKRQKEEAKILIPLLLQKMTQPEYKVNVSHYEGIEGVKLVIEDALYCKSSHWDIIAPIDNFFSQLDNNYRQYFIATRKARKLTSRALWEEKESQKKLTLTELRERNPRILPKNMFGKFRSVICLYDDKILILNSVKELSGILIQSKEAHDTMAAVFEGLWISSQPIK